MLKLLKSMLFISVLFVCTSPLYAFDSQESSFDSVSVIGITDENGEPEINNISDTQVPILTSAPTIIWPKGSDKEYAKRPLNLLAERDLWGLLEDFKVLSIIPLQNAKNQYSIRIQGSLPTHLKDASLAFSFRTKDKPLQQNECAAKLTKDGIILIDAIVDSKLINTLVLDAVALSFPEWEGIEISLINLNTSINRLIGWEEALFLIDTSNQQNVSQQISSIRLDEFSTPTILEDIVQDNNISNAEVVSAATIETLNTPIVREIEIFDSLTDERNRIAGIVIFGIAMSIIVILFILNANNKLPPFFHSTIPSDITPIPVSYDTTLTKQFYATLQELAVANKSPITANIESLENDSNIPADEDEDSVVYEVMGDAIADESNYTRQQKNKNEQPSNGDEQSDPTNLVDQITSDTSSTSDMSSTKSILDKTVDHKAKIINNTQENPQKKEPTLLPF